MKFGLKALLVFCLPVALIFVLNVHSQAADAAKGAELYKKCSGCHTPNPKFGGKPMDYLSGKMMHYRDGKFDKPAVQNMQKAFAGMSDQDIADLASYVSNMKK